MKKCPTCKNYSVVFEEYYGRKICLMREGGWSELSSKKTQFEKKRNGIFWLSDSPDELLEMPVYDKNHSRIGTFYTWSEGAETLQHSGVFIDPHLCNSWKIPCQSLLPISPKYISKVEGSITLEKTLEELREYWKQTSISRELDE